MDRIHLAQDRHQWQGVVKMVMKILFVIFIPFKFCNRYIHRQINYRDNCHEFYFIKCKGGTQAEGV